ncbi:MAG TPA: response regulator transcription factor [Thermoanaerobaculia bacterium]|nr:response regulator transcription factor [Thermoanaerobaculia bacterium]
MSASISHREVSRITEERPVRTLIGVLVVDDHLVVRKGVRALLMDADGIAVVGEAADGLEAVAEARRLEPQVILMDLKLPRLDGVEAIREILAEQPNVGIVVLTGADADEQVLSAVEAGALGYLAKTAERESFLQAIARVARGELWLPPRLTRKLLSHLKPRPSLGPEEPLTSRETSVLTLLAKGRTNQQIASELCIAEATVRTHVSHILDKLGASNRVEAALHALRVGVATLEEP